jgi:hypothetical protein
MQSNSERTMHRYVPGLVVVAALIGGVAPVLAQQANDSRANRKPATGSYEVKFEEIANNCENKGMTLSSERLALAERASGKIEVSMPMTPVMLGTISSTGKFRAQTKLDGIGGQGGLGKFSISGRVTGSSIELVFIAEFYNSQKKPICTQSWNGSGVRKGAL